MAERFYYGGGCCGAGADSREDIKKNPSCRGVPDTANRRGTPQSAQGMGCQRDANPDTKIASQMKKRLVAMSPEA